MNYDDWKLSNPIDDGNVTNMVSACCGVELTESEYSECCGAKVWENTDVCSRCKEHSSDYMVCGECGDTCDEIEDYEYEEQQRESAEEMARDGERDES